MLNLISEIKHIKQKSKKSDDEHQQTIVNDFRYNHSLRSGKSKIIKMSGRAFLHKTFYHSINGSEEQYDPKQGIPCGCLNAAIERKVADENG